MRTLLGSVAIALACGFPASAETDAAIFRIFLKDGTSVASFGEYSRTADRVVYSMPVGGSPDNPRLQLVWVPASVVDWPRTEQYAASARYQRYALSRGEEDFHLLSNDVARALNDIALSTDRGKAMQIAEDARRMLAEWPRGHYGYRQEDVREIVGLIDEAIADMRATGSATQFELSLVAVAPEPAVTLEPVLPLPSPREQLQHTLHMAGVVDSAAERMALLNAVMGMIADPGTGLVPSEATALRRATERLIREEQVVDRRYAEMSRRLTLSASRAAERARINVVEGVLTQIEREDARLGRRRPEAVGALRASVEARLADARRLRLLRDQWQVRVSLYQDYQRTVGWQVVQLVKAQKSLEAIRSLDGPKLATLATLRQRLGGGADRLARVPVAPDLRTTHDLLVGAWRFAETAARARHEAVSSGDVGKAWEASSAAAGSIMMLARAQSELRTLLETPSLR